VQYDTMQDSRTIILHVRELYGENSRNSRFQLTLKLYGTKMAEGSSVNDHVLKMINAIDRLAALGIIHDAELRIDLILHSLPPFFSSFITNFNMNRITTTLADLLNMPREAEVNIRKGNAPVMVVGQSCRPKRKGEPLDPLVEASASQSPTKGPCFYCGKSGHWKRNCITFIKSIGKRMPYLTFIKMNMYILDSSSKILDSGCGTHICSNFQALTDRRNLEKGEGDLQPTDGLVVEAITVGSVCILLPSGQSLVLKHCVYSP
ncbi:zf-CCHC domain-containing protein/UBN2_2 domain-containing protein, partial [Cephalotus follicularis]